VRDEIARRDLRRPRTSAVLTACRHDVDLAKRVKEVAGDYAHIVIDTGRSATEEDPILRQALIVTDHLVVSFAPSLMDVRELGRVLQLADDLAAIHPLATHLLLTKVRAGTNSARDARCRVG
jgi:chromosome partitioning protein